MTKPYVGMCWAPGIMSTAPVFSLEIIGHDLKTEVRATGITGDIELWAKTDGTKGFFVGDTAELAETGWTKLATL